jgi:hypothetical protein
LEEEKKANFSALELETLNKVEWCSVLGGGT